MTKITAEHLARSACVYIRQSTADQLAHNHESRRRQYGLVDRAKQLGWSVVEVIDDDLGRSGGGRRVEGLQHPKNHPRHLRSGVGARTQRRQRHVVRQHRSPMTGRRLEFAPP